MNAMEISRTGLDVEWRRLELIAQNIANAGTTVMPNGETYRPMRMISGPVPSFSAALTREGRGEPGGVAVYSIEPQTIAPRRSYEPGHPQADEAGYVTYPGFDHAAEMTLMLKTSRSYEANIVAMNAARQMYANALQIGKRA